MNRRPNCFCHLNDLNLNADGPRLIPALQTLTNRSTNLTETTWDECFGNATKLLITTNTEVLIESLKFLLDACEHGLHCKVWLSWKAPSSRLCEILETSRNELLTNLVWDLITYLVKGRLFIRSKDSDRLVINKFNTLWTTSSHRREWIKDFLR